MSTHTALYDVHAALGAHFTDFAGWSMPLRYGSELAEHHAVRRAAGLFDLSHMGEIEVTGRQAAAFLDYAVVSNVGVLVPGKAKYTMICRPDGGILDDLIVYRLADEHFLVVANAANTAVVLAALQERVAGFDAQVLDRVDAWSLIAIQGPRAAGILGPLTAVDLPGLKYYTVATGTVAGVAANLARTGYTGEDGFEIFCDPAHATTVWQALMTAGAADGLIPCGLACRDSLRLEAAMPLYGHELSVELTPYEAGLGRVVALAKPDDFVGKDALAQRSTVPVRRLRVGLQPAGPRAPRAGYPVYAAAAGPDAPAVGVVTSGAPSPTLGRPIAMAYVDIELTEPGTELTVDVRGTRVAATVVPLPFYARPR